MTSKHLLALNAAREAFEYTSNTPALEGRVLDTLKNVLTLGRTALTNAFNTTIGNVSILNFKPSFTSQDQYRKITPANFVQFSQVMVPTREGFTGNYNAFADLLIEQLKYKEGVDKCLQETNSLLGRLISSKDERISWRDDTSKIEKSIKLREAMNDELKPFFSGNRDVAHAYVGDLVSNVADLKALDSKAHQMEGFLKSIDLGAFNNHARKVNDLITLMVGDIESKKIEDITKAQLSNLANHVVELANQLEHLAIIYYHAVVFLRQVQDVQKAASKVV